MKIILLQPKTNRDDWQGDGIDVYLEKIGRYYKIEEAGVGSKKMARSQSADKKNFECQNLLEFLDPSDFVIAMDEKGKKLSSIEWSKQFQTGLNSGKKRIVFVVGGAFGLNDEIRSRANLVLSLSAMTMNHHLAMLVLVEQIYRGISIIKNLPYHNEG